MLVSTLSGELLTRDLIGPSASKGHPQEVKSRPVAPIYFDVGLLAKVEESESSSDEDGARVARGVEIIGSISEPGDSDQYQWNARQGEMWAIDADAIEQAGQKLLDPFLFVLDSKGQRVLRTRLQALRDSYFTFRGKNSDQIGDFRLFGWKQMRLNDFLYAAGEVTRLSIYPRGPDSGFNVYPNSGKRSTFFGTTHSSHALGEPCYIVRPLGDTEKPIANGLPLFRIYYENDDDPSRVAGSSSRLVFRAPANDTYSVVISDTRSEGGEGYAYRLKVRPSQPTFHASVIKIEKPLHPGTGREFQVSVDRFDEFDGPVTFDLVENSLPEGISSNLPITIEAGQKTASGMIWTSKDMTEKSLEFEPQLVARAEILGRVVERVAGSVGVLKIGGPSKFMASLQPSDHEVRLEESWTLRVRRGETVTAKVVLQRADKNGEQDRFTAEVPFGKENAGRNATFGVYVDHIGLNGLLVRENEDTREFSLTADPQALPGQRSFFLTGKVDGGITTQVIIVEVLP